MKALSILTFGASALLATLIGRGSAHPPPTSSSIAPAVATAHGDDCRGGEEDAVTVRLDPDAIVHGPRGERIALGVHVHHHFADPAAVVGAVEVIDDRGQRVGARRDLPARALAARAATAYEVETPDQLADGYYRVQVSVLARARGAAVVEDFSTHQLYFHVAGGTVTPVTSNEWLTRSQAGLVFTAR